MLLSGYRNCFRIPELKKRIFFTCAMIALCRLLSVLPCPGVNPAGLKSLFGGGASGEGGVLDMLNLFSGGAIEQFAVGALGIMPYISASIILQLLTPVIPSLERMLREGESGQKKYNQYMRYLTLVICVVQGVMYASVMANPSSIGLKGGSVVLHPGLGFTVMTVITLTAGAMLVMWIGEMITDKGIGNGASLIITVNILARLPGALQSLFKQMTGAGASDNELNLIHLLILIVMFVVVTAATVALTLGAYRVPIRYASKRMVGIGGTATAQTSFLPLRINYSGVMPIIFAGAILSFPLMLMRYLPQDWGWVVWIEMHLQYGSTGYVLTYGVMILVFSFFWVANQFNPIKIADDLQKNGGYIPGIRAGEPTATFLGKTMDRITLAGAIFLGVLAVLPMLLSSSLNIQPVIAQFFGGTSLLIIVGVTLDTLQQIEGYLVTRNYEGFMEKGRLRSRKG